MTNRHTKDFTKMSLFACSYLFVDCFLGAGKTQATHDVGESSGGTQESWGKDRKHVQEVTRVSYKEFRSYKISFKFYHIT